MTACLTLAGARRDECDSVRRLRCQLRFWNARRVVRLLITASLKTLSSAVLARVNESTSMLAGTRAISVEGTELNFTAYKDSIFFRRRLSRFSLLSVDLRAYVHAFVLARVLHNDD